MKVVILAGGRGTRISEESHMRPKPMVEIGGKPILWHIMKYYSSFGCNDFIVCLGYKGYMIKEYFANYFLHTSDVTIHVKENRMDVHAGFAEPWSVTLVDTGLETMTGGRIRRIARFVDAGGPFHMTYGDGLSDVDLNALRDFHEKHRRAATVTAIMPQGRFGAVEIDERNGRVDGFQEKPDGDGRWINGGFFVLTSAVFDVISGDDCIWEREPMEKLAQGQQLGAFKHRGYWQAMDTLREKEVLEDQWQSGNAPWKKW
jgi:glucose-1-phosphate cytidylyltransferase